MSELYKGANFDKEVIAMSCRDCAHRNVCVQAHSMNTLKKDICEIVIESGVPLDFLSSIEIKCPQYLAPQVNERSSGGTGVQFAI